MGGYLELLPLDLINLLILNLPSKDIESLNVVLEECSIWDHFDSVNNWKSLFGSRFPEIYKSIVHLQSIDHTLRSHRYKYGWKILFIDFVFIGRYFNPENINLAFLHNSDSTLVGISAETINTILAIKLFKDHPDVYKYALLLPDTPVTKQQFYEHISSFKPGSLKPDNLDMLIDTKNLDTILVGMSHTWTDYVISKIKTGIINYFDLIYSRSSIPYFYYIKSYYIEIIKRIFEKLTSAQVSSIVVYVAHSCTHQDIDLIKTIALEAKPELKDEIRQPVKRMLLFPD